MSDIETLRIMHNEVAKVANQVQTVVDDLKWLFEYNAIDAPAAYEDVRREIEVKLINALGKVNALPTFSTPIEKPAAFESRNQHRDYPPITPNTRFLGYSPEEVDMLMKRAGLK